MADNTIPNRTIFIRDNLEVMRGMNSESVDLIYLDPPFNSGHARRGYAGLSDLHGHPPLGDAPHPQTNRKHLPALRPYRQSLP